MAEMLRWLAVLWRRLNYSLWKPWIHMEHQQGWYAPYDCYLCNRERVTRHA